MHRVVFLLSQLPAQQSGEMQKIVPVLTLPLARRCNFLSVNSI